MRKALTKDFERFFFMSIFGFGGDAAVEIKAIGVHVVSKIWSH